MLDLSIKQLRSKYKTSEQILDFMTSPSTVEHKTDGVKLTIVKIANNGDLGDWLVSYKGSLFYRGEFDYQDTVGKRITMGNSQFDVVFDHLETLGKTNIEINTELFCEFLVRKTTVMSEYSTTGKIILLGYGFASPVLRYGKIKTNSQNLLTKARTKYAKELKVNTPRVLCRGRWFPTSEIIAGSEEPLKSALLKNRRTLEAAEDRPLDYYNRVVKLFLEVESEFGGKEEGIVVDTKDGLFKIQQDYQLDKEARYGKKLLHMEDDPQKEQAYWDDVLEISKKIASEIKTSDIQKGLKEIANKIKQLNFEGAHSKKSKATIMDDIQLNAKNFYLKSLPGNNGSLVIGKFRILTNGHVKMIKQAIQESDEVVIGVVTGSRTKNSNDLRVRMVNRVFPNIKIIELSSGNLFTAFKKADININQIFAGSDRVADYRKMLSKAPGIEVKEIHRTNSDISATKVIDNIHSFDFFKENTPKEIWDYYHEIKDFYYEI